MKLEYDPRALKDLREIADFIQQNDPHAAQNLVRELQEACEFLLKFPEAWPRVRTGPTGYRVRHVRRYAIYYRYEPGEKIVIVGVLHTARILGGLLRERSATKH